MSTSSRTRSPPLRPDLVDTILPYHGEFHLNLMRPYCWFNADEQATNMVDDGGGVISGWTDGAGGMLASTTGTARPVWSATGFIGTKPAVVFDGVDDCFTSTSLSTLPTGAVGCEMWAVIDQLSLGADDTERVIMRYGGGAGAFRNMSRVAPVGINQLRVGDGAINVTSILGGLDGPCIVSAFFYPNATGALEGGSINGRELVNGAIAEMTTTTARFRLAATIAAGPTNFFQGAIRHAVILPRLTIANRIRAQGWFAHDSGITSILPRSHRYKYQRP